MVGLQQGPLNLVGMKRYWPSWSQWELHISPAGQAYRMENESLVRLEITVDDKHTHSVSVLYSNDFRKKRSFQTRYSKIPVAVLVLECFKGPRPSRRHKACHWNDDPADNSVENVYWGTEREQSLDRRRNRGCNHRPKAIYVNPWIHDAMREFHARHFPAADLPIDHKALAENILRDFLNDRWPAWVQWVEERRHAPRKS